MIRFRTIPNETELVYLLWEFLGDYEIYYGRDDRYSYNDNYCRLYTESRPYFGA